MKTKQRAEIIIEKERVVLIASKRNLLVWCDGCGSRVTMVDPERAAVISGLGQRAIFRRIESGSLHYTESKNGTFLICLLSLREAAT